MPPASRPEGSMNKKGEDEKRPPPLTDLHRDGSH